MELDKPNPANDLMLFKKQLWITEYSTRMQKWFSGEKLPPVRIDAELHRRCNLSCIHCVRRASQKDLTEESKEIEVDEARWVEAAEESGRMGARMWNIAGIGEPMCKPDLLMKMMKAIKHHKMFGELTTNGTLWKEKDIRQAILLGWDSLNISIDAPEESLHDAIRRVPGTFSRAVRTVKTFSRLRKQSGFERPCLTINMVLNRMNYKTLPKMVDFVHEIGADAIFVEPMIVHTDMGRDIRLTSSETSELRKLIEKSEKLAYSKNVMAFISCLDGDDEKKEFNKDLVEKTSEIREVILERNSSNESPVQDVVSRVLGIPCYYPWFYLIINADGSVIHCGECSDLQENIKTRSLKDIWYGEHFTKLREQFANNEMPAYCDKCRPNVISDMCLVRKSIKEYADIPNLQKKLIQLFIDNIHLKEQVYYAKNGITPPKKKLEIFKKIDLFRF